MAEMLAVSFLTAFIMAVDASPRMNTTTAMLQFNLSTSPSLSSIPITLPNCLPLVSPPILGVIQVTAGSTPCSGVVYLQLGHLHPLPLCNNSITKLNKQEVCKSWRCGSFQTWKVLQQNMLGYWIANGTVMNTTCQITEIHCEAGSVDKEMSAYRTATALLCTLLLLLLLAIFGPATYKTVMQRKLEKRKDRWIGPMQSQSVSFHRVQAGIHPNSDTDKRQSSIGLERLMVNSSREPSSNRNSNCDSYN
ncbi:T-cell surface glycoprotein CD5-like [Scleropages formosus]|uniref:T-cell surface glycoprotein CD5-like n=1 Tax=Scleropages formosus TaxID=113540 RepID=UPI000878C32F|nr:T-cell surface glycoprotein CD5-like [Scleropages formosus]XP_018605710.1 T-cell surface glycoprotein CD5-like [Scleropages formosus]